LPPSAGKCSTSVPTVTADIAIAAILAGSRHANGKSAPRADAINKRRKDASTTEIIIALTAGERPRPLGPPLKKA
jgi:hypothetical protein